MDAGASSQDAINAWYCANVLLIYYQPMNLSERGLLHVA